MDRRSVRGGDGSAVGGGRAHYPVEMESVGDHYEYAKKDLLGHGAFACVFKGRTKAVRSFVSLYFIRAQKMTQKASRIKAQ